VRAIRVGRELIDAGEDKCPVRRDAQSGVKESNNAGRALGSRRHGKARTNSPGQGSVGGHCRPAHA